jgi:hypothetical protein
MTSPILDWGNPETLRNFFRVITRSDYGGLKLHPEESHFAWTFSSVINQLKFFSKLLFNQFGLFVYAPILWLFIRKKHFFDSLPLRFCAVTFIISGPCFVILSNLPITAETSAPILEPYYLMINLFFLPFIFMGFISITKKVESYFLGKSRISTVKLKNAMSNKTVNIRLFPKKYDSTFFVIEINPININGRKNKLIIK